MGQRACAPIRACDYSHRIAVDRVSFGEDCVSLGKHYPRDHRCSCRRRAVAGTSTKCREERRRIARMWVFRSLRELNESIPERITDHSPIIVDLPLQELSLTTSLLRG